MLCSNFKVVNNLFSVIELERTWCVSFVCSLQQHIFLVELLFGTSSEFWMHAAHQTDSADILLYPLHHLELLQIIILVIYYPLELKKKKSKALTSSNEQIKIDQQEPVKKKWCQTNLIFQWESGKT